jgi:hypothetical protein
MFTILSDLARIQEDIIPYSSHEKNMLRWQDVYHTSLKQLLHDSEFDNDTKTKIKISESLLFNLYDSFYKYSKNNISKDILKSRIEKIYNAKQVEQRTTQWYEDMKCMLTASEYYKLFESERTRGQLVLSKVNPEKRNSILALPTQSMSPMDWGVRFEPIIKNYLEHTWNCSIYDCGRLKHETQSRLGASPDGIIVSEDSDKYARLVEIKCPYSRKIGGIVPQEYWMQMQIQLEVTNLNECEYVEVEILSANPKNMTPDLSGNYLEKGIIWLLEKEGIYKYVYSESEKQILLNEGFNEFESIEYAITKVHNIVIKRDTKWYNSTLEKQAEFWNDVEKARNNEFVLAEPKYKRQKQCMIIEEST